MRAAPHRCVLRDGRVHRMRADRCGVRIEGLAEADGLYPVQSIGDGFTALFVGEDLSDEGNPHRHRRNPVPPPAHRRGW